jgi:hypothetical protein
MLKQVSSGARIWPIAAVLGTVLSVVGVQQALAQEKCQRKLDNSGAESKYTEQHVMDVGDVEGHQIRIFELHRTYASDQPNCEGLKRKENWSRGYSDYVDLNGRAWGYTVIVFDNGDKIFGEFSGTSHTVVTEDDKKQSTYVGVTNYTGGTGTYQGVRGIARDKISFDPIANVNIAESEEEYWIVK